MGVVEVLNAKSQGTSGRKLTGGKKSIKPPLLVHIPDSDPNLVSVPGLRDHAHTDSKTGSGP